MMYRISVIRRNVRRTADMSAFEARRTVIEAVQHGFEVSCRPLGKHEKPLAGVWEEKIVTIGLPTIR